MNVLKKLIGISEQEFDGFTHSFSVHLTDTDRVTVQYQVKNRKGEILDAYCHALPVGIVSGLASDLDTALRQLED